MINESCAAKCETVWICRHEECGCWHGLLRSQGVYELALGQNAESQREHDECQTCLIQNLFKKSCIKKTDQWALSALRVKCDKKHVFLPYKRRNDWREIEYYLSLSGHQISGFCCKGLPGRKLEVSCDHSLFQRGGQMCAIKIITPKCTTPLIVNLYAHVHVNKSADIYAKNLLGSESTLIAQIPHVEKLLARSSVKFHAGGPTFLIEFSSDYALILEPEYSAWCRGLIACLQAHGVRHYRQYWALDDDEQSIKRQTICEAFFFPSQHNFPAVDPGGSSSTLNAVDNTVCLGAYMQTFASMSTKYLGVRYSWSIVGHVLGNILFVGVENHVLDYRSLLLRYHIKKPLGQANIFSPTDSDNKRIVWHFSSNDFSILLASNPDKHNAFHISFLEKDGVLESHDLNFDEICQLTTVRDIYRGQVQVLSKCLWNKTSKIYYTPPSKIIFPTREGSFSVRCIVLQELRDGRAGVIYYPDYTQGFNSPRQVLSAGDICAQPVCLKDAKASIDSDGHWKISWQINRLESCVIQEEPSSEKTVRLRITNNFCDRATRDVLCYFSENEECDPSYMFTMYDKIGRIHLHWQGILSKCGAKDQDALRCNFHPDKVNVSAHDANAWLHWVSLQSGFQAVPKTSVYDSLIKMRFVRKNSGYDLEFLYQPQGVHPWLVPKKYIIHLECRPYTISKYWEEKHMESVVFKVLDVRQNTHYVYVKPFDRNNRFDHSLHFWHDDCYIEGVRTSCEMRS